MDPRIPRDAPIGTGAPTNMPKPVMIPVYPPEIPAQGWWTDPYRPGPDPQDPHRPAEGPLCQRFHDGVHWTAFISYRVDRHVSQTGWSPITSDPAPLSQPAPKLGARAIEDYDFLPEHTVFAFDPPDPVVAGWWRDPFTQFGQRYHDGTRWTQYRFIQPSRGIGSVSEVPAEHQPRRPIDDYRPGPLRTDRSMLYGVGCMLGGGLVLALSSALDRDSAASEWTVRFGLIALLGALLALAIQSIQFAAHPKELGPRDRSAWLLPAIYLFLIGGILFRSWDDVLRSIWLR
jgi:hypothetical protein